MDYEHERALKEMEDTFAEPISLDKIEKYVRKFIPDLEIPCEDVGEDNATWNLINKL